MSIQLFKYCVVGGINTLLTGIVFYIALRIYGIHYLISLVIAWGLGIIFTYVGNFLWVFRPEDKLRFQERFTKYVITQLSSFLGNIGILYLLVSVYGFDAWYVQLVLIPLIVVVNFSFTKYWSLRRYN